MSNMQYQMQESKCKEGIIQNKIKNFKNLIEIKNNIFFRSEIFEHALHSMHRVSKVE